MERAPLLDFFCISPLDVRGGLLFAWIRRLASDIVRGSKFVSFILSFLRYNESYAFALSFCTHPITSTAKRIPTGDLMIKRSNGIVLAVYVDVGLIHWSAMTYLLCTTGAPPLRAAHTGISAKVT